MIIALATLGFLVAVRQVYLHFRYVHSLKTENTWLRHYWKNSM